MGDQEDGRGSKIREEVRGDIEIKAAGWFAPGPYCSAFGSTCTSYVSAAGSASPSTCTGTGSNIIKQRHLDRAVVTFSEPVPMQVDGEELPYADKYEVHVLPKALRIIMP